MNMKKYGAEFLGTMWLVIGGCGAAVFSAAFPAVGIGLLGVSLAFGLTVLTMAYAIGPISGCHLNPAVTVGLAVAGRHPKGEVIQYIIAQTLGAIVGTGILYLLLSGQEGFTGGTFAANGFGENSPGHFSMMSGFIAEVVMTAFFLLIILGSTSKKAAAGFAPIAIGLGLTLIHLISIPITNTSVNPARSMGPALFAGGTHLSQVWLFWVAPIVGAVVGALMYKGIEE